MPSSDRQPLAEPELAWLLHSAMVWAVTGALMMMARRPLWSAVGVVLTVLGLGVAGWMVRRAAAPPTATAADERDLPASQQQARPPGPPGRQEGRHERVPTRPESGQPTASEQRSHSPLRSPLS
jgi:hypothetical protein